MINNRYISICNFFKLSFTYTGNKTTKLSKIFKQIDKNINIEPKTNRKLINIIGTVSKTIIYSKKRCIQTFFFFH